MFKFIRRVKSRLIAFIYNGLNKLNEKELYEKTLEDLRASRKELDEMRVLRNKLIDRKIKELIASMDASKMDNYEEHSEVRIDIRLAPLYRLRADKVFSIDDLRTNNVTIKKGDEVQKKQFPQKNKVRLYDPETGTYFFLSHNLFSLLFEKIPSSEVNKTQKTADDSITPL